MKYDYNSQNIPGVKHVQIPKILCVLVTGFATIRPARNSLSSLVPLSCKENVFISKQERTTAVFVSAILLIVGVVLHNYFSPLAILYVFVPKTPVSWEDPSLTA